MKPPEAGTEGDVTILLRAWSAGDADAAGRLAPMLYKELKQIARHCMAHERKDHTLQPTALVNEAFLRMFKAQGLEVHDRAHFFALSARMMRRILISYSVARRSGKREGVLNTIPLDEAAMASPANNVEMLELNQALEKLARVDARKAQMVELHFFGGLSFEETAAALQVSTRTIHRDWIFVKAWLAREMGRETNTERSMAG